MRLRISVLAMALPMTMLFAAAPDAGAQRITETVRVAKVARYGKLLVGPNGRTLYLFEADSGTKSACTGGCASAWPALAAPKPTAGPGVAKAKLSKATGQKANHVTYNGHLLYYFAGDSKAGDVNGAAVAQWFPVSPAGAKIAAK